MTVQGILRDALGQPVEGSVSFELELRSGDTAVFTETESWDLRAGLFTITLGDTSPISPDIFAGAGPVSLVIKVDGDEMAPIVLTSVPYAFRAHSAESADAYMGDVDWAQLVGVPAGFADGTDDGAMGTTYGAGDGLTLTGNTFAVAYGGAGAATTASRSDHAHAPPAWSSVTGVPAGFADGVDDVGGPPAWSSITSVPAGFADGVDDVGGPPAWSSITGVPAGFADGVDDVGTGDITGVTAAAGLTGGGTAGDVSLGVDYGGTGTSTQVARADHDHGGVLTMAQLTYGRTSSNPGQSCLDIKSMAPWAEDGVYLVDPDGSGPINPLRVLCDMTRDGGGWTLGIKNRYMSGIAGRGGSFGTVDDIDAPTADFYKLADATINALISDGTFDILADQVGWNSAYSSGNHEYVLVRNYTATFSFTAIVPDSTSTTVFESYRAADDLLVWRGRLRCGGGGVGINCYDILPTPSPVGTANPQGGNGCLYPLGSSSNTGWHHFYMSETNTDTYLYICNGAQHTSSYNLSHRWWFR
ncbi:MAG: hypothetical protein JRH11_08730 [Deltaproteobacteria bacterium]|nr:hypothetical protein [Deltaproteobacteria bacterium]